MSHGPLGVARLSGCSWLITGGTGFVGSVLIEQLLRTLSPSKVVLLIRAKRGLSGRQRLEKLLSRPLYNTVRTQYGGTAGLMERFEVLEQGLSGDALQVPAVDVVVHAAASVSFDNHIHDAIADNYTATQLVLAAAREMPGLKAFVHISTCYVNDDLPRGSRIPEESFPLLAEDGSTAEHSQLAAELSALPAAEAEARARQYLRGFGLPNNYSLTKRLAEGLLLDAQRQGLPVAVLRTSIIGATSQDHVAPGYLGNAAGPTALVVAVAYGFWTCTEWRAEHISDVIPCDRVTSSIIVAAAAAASGAFKGAGQPPILQCAASAVQPMTNEQFYQAIIRRAQAQPAPMQVFSGYPKPHFSNIYCGSAEKYRARLRKASRRIKMQCLGLKLLGQFQVAAALRRRWKLFKVMSAKTFDFHLVFHCDRLAALHAALSPEEQKLFPCTWAQSDDLDQYLDLYIGAVWDRYVLPQTTATAGKGSAPGSGKGSATGGPPKAQSMACRSLTACRCWVKGLYGSSAAVAPVEAKAAGAAGAAAPCNCNRGRLASMRQLVVSTRAMLPAAAQAAEAGLEEV